MNKKNIIFIILNMIMSLIILFPLLYALSMSFMSPDDIFNIPPRLIPSKLFAQNYKDVISCVPLGKFLLNSLLVSTIVTIGQITTSSLAAFSFSYFEFKGKKILFFMVLASLMIPWEAIIISNYLTVSNLGLTDNYLGLIVPYLTSAFGIFLIRQYYLTVPKELHEAAQIDGMSNFKFFIKVLLPISQPVIISLSIYTFLNTWNQYLWPLLVTNSDYKRTVQIGISMLKFAEGLNFGLVMAGIVIILLPSIILFLVGHRQLVEGLTEGSIKG